MDHHGFILPQMCEKEINNLENILYVVLSILIAQLQLDLKYLRLRGFQGKDCYCQAGSAIDYTMSAILK